MSLGVCQYCGRQNDAGAQFCSDCGKPLTKAAAARAAVAAGGISAGVVSRTSGGPPGSPSPSPGGASVDAPCPLCGTVVNAGGGGGGRRPIPDPPPPPPPPLVSVSPIGPRGAACD